MLQNIKREDKLEITINSSKPYTVSARHKNSSMDVLQVHVDVVEVNG